MPRSRAWIYRIAAFALGSLSVASLLLYFLGVARFASLAALLSGIELAGLTAIVWRARARSLAEVSHVVVAGIWAGAIATVAYDVVRVPIVHGGVPVFKAISYFGAVFLGTARPSLASEIAGWAYHLSNGASFGLMYAAICARPRWWSAVLWGMLLEVVMLLTPYAEVFGYQRDARFLAITLGSHAVYGAVLWLGLRYFDSVSRRGAVLAAVGVPLALALLAADFNRSYASRIPAAPPPYLGPHLYASWSTLEPDRVAAMWVMKRFVDPAAEFCFVGPFDRMRFGTPFDVPEASVRRQAARSATAYLIESRRVALTPALSKLRRMTELVEVSPWMLPSDPQSEQLAQTLRDATERECGPALRAECIPRLLAELDRWYDGK